MKMRKYKRRSQIFSGVLLDTHYAYEAAVAECFYCKYDGRDHINELFSFETSS